MKELSLSRGKVALVDDGDFENANRPPKWYAVRAPNTDYAARSVSIAGGKRKRQYLHHFLTGWPRVDHRNGNGLDNQRGNLRPASPRQNNQNKSKRAGCTSRFKGVALEPGGKFRAQISINGRQTRLGTFSDEVSAALVYDAAALKHYGEFARTNKQMGLLNDFCSTNGSGQS